MIKTYQLINDINLITSVICDGKLKSISFAGGMKNSGEDIRHGSYTTADEKMQKALEADSGFSSVFHCITPPPVKPATSPRKDTRIAPGAASDDSAGNTDTEGSEIVDNSSGLIQVVPGITNKQAAIEWLATNKGIGDLKPTCKVEAVKNAAALSDVKFPDWK